MAVHILGIRHHGVGSAKNVEKRLAEIQPDIVLIEGPPEMTDILAFANNEKMQPPVAIMIYNQDIPTESSFYPFSEFSPEWVAIQYALKNNIPVKAIDMPAELAFHRKRQTTDIEENESENEILSDEKNPSLQSTYGVDVLKELSQISGFESRESWWNYYFETATPNETHFEATDHAMQLVREIEVSDEENEIREAFMRTFINKVQNEFYSNIAVVCGAFHAPAIADIDKNAKADAKLLKALPKTKLKITATWIPWTNGRLSMYSGYGAGIESPGWYQHLWKQRNFTEIRWLVKVAKTFRKKGFDVSTAHILETYRLSMALAGLRNLSKPGLEELNEAIITVMCMGDAIQLNYIKDKLIVGEKLGKVPDELPKVPLQEDFESNLKSLRLKLTAEPTEVILDLRKEIDLKKSIFLYRLLIIELTWCKLTYSKSKGTFKEAWKVEWQPQMLITLIDKSYLGNTIEKAAEAFLLKQAEELTTVSSIAELINKAIPAELFQVIDMLLKKIEDLSGISADMMDLITAIPALAEISRYGNVRNSDISVVQNILYQLLIKVFINLKNTCYGQNEDTSNQLFDLIIKINQSVLLLEDAELVENWHNALRETSENDGVHAIIQGGITRILFDAGKFEENEAEIKISSALSLGNEVKTVASWLEGFLRGNGMILIYDHNLWNRLYTWVESLNTETFTELLPLLRRVFSKFEYAERRQIGEKAKRGISQIQQTEKRTDTLNFDSERAKSILPIIASFINE